MNCPYCENAIPVGQTKCPACGAPVPASVLQQQQQQQQQQAYPPQQPYQQQPYQQPQQQPVIINNYNGGGVKKSPSTAGCLSFLICGLGQMYNGQVLKGIVLLVACAVLGAATAGIGAAVIWIVGIIDASNIAKKINAGKQVGPWEFF